ncbi:MAG: zinc-ribbon domain-containing protein [Planctomycetota bacterium]
MKQPEPVEGDDEYFICSHCGADVRLDARACPQCGSDDETGWAKDADKWQADIPTGYAKDEDFDYDEYIQREFTEKQPFVFGLPSGLFWILVLIFMVAVAVTVLLFTD